MQTLLYQGTFYTSWKKRPYPLLVKVQNKGNSVLKVTSKAHEMLGCSFVYKFCLAILVKYGWANHITHQQKAWVAVAMPGYIEDVILTFNAIVASWAEAAWIHNNYKYPIHFGHVLADMRPYGCSEDTQGLLPNMYCANYSRFPTRKMDQLYFVTIKQIGVRRSFWSWVDSSELCKEIGSSFPIFRDKDDQLDLIALLSLTSHSFCFEALFVGLQTRPPEVGDICFAAQSTGAATSKVS